MADQWPAEWKPEKDLLQAIVSLKLAGWAGYTTFLAGDSMLCPWHHCWLLAVIDPAIDYMIPLYEWLGWLILHLQYYGRCCWGDHNYDNSVAVPVGYQPLN